MSDIDFSDLLPEGYKLREKKKREKIDLSEFLEPKAPLEPQITSPPLAIELHILEQHCVCGEVFTSPAGAFVEVLLKRLHGRSYREEGKVLLPLPRERPRTLLSLPHRTKIQTQSITMCQHCYQRESLYNDLKLQPQEAWLALRPPVLSEAWRQFQFSVCQNREKLQELIEQIEARERFKDAETKLTPPQPCDPEPNFEE